MTLFLRHSLRILATLASPKLFSLGKAYEKLCCFSWLFSRFFGVTLEEYAKILCIKAVQKIDDFEGYE